MPLHPLIQTTLAAAQGVASYHQLSIAMARAQAKLGYPPRQPAVPVGSVRDLVIPGPAGGLPVRVYAPVAPGPHPLVVFFHGSGFVLLDLDTHDDLCRRLCAGADCAVVSVDYRLAPEHKFPAAPNDCLAATRWAAEHAASLGADPSRVVVAGDSAGACLAAVTAIRLRDEGGPALRGQLLFYPVTAYPSPAPASYATCGTGYGLTAAGMHWFWQQYLPDLSQAGHAHVSPLLVDSARGLPAACVLIAQYDVLRDEGAAYAERLREAGITTLSRSYDGMNHGFLKYAGQLPAADAALADACDWLRETSGSATARHQAEVA